MAQRQLDGAGAIVVTKLDSLPERRDAVLATCARGRRPTSSSPRAMARFPLALLFDAAVPERGAMPAVSRSHRAIGHDAMPAFASVTVAAPDVLDKARLRAWLKALPRDPAREGHRARRRCAGARSPRACGPRGASGFRRWEMTAGRARRRRRDGVHFIDAAVAALRDGIVQCSVAASTVALTSNVD